MHKVNNRKTINGIVYKCIKSNRLRNCVAIVAIALTTILFTTIFTIGLTVNKAFQEANFRQTGGYAHGTFKYLTSEQYEEIKTDSLIKEYGLRRFVGMPMKEPFHKAHVEVSYADELERKWMYLEPDYGAFPKEETKEAATDTRVLELLGITPRIGEEFTITFEVDGEEITETFLLSGWWKYDEAIVASHVLIPESRAVSIFETLDTKGIDQITASYNMDVMFPNASNIDSNIEEILLRHGFQGTNPSGENYIATGVNWGYTGAQLSNNMDSITLAAIIGLFLIIIVTGYLIIYNIFQISVASDIRFYGLLKTIGTTPSQLKRIIRYQALILSVIGIPIGLVLGYCSGTLLTPVILHRLNGVVLDVRSTSPVIFVGAALFSLFTVLLSCSKPGRIAASVSPIEAIRYTDGTINRNKKLMKRNCKSISLIKMAFANLGRNKGKTVITVISLSLAVILLNVTFTFTKGFDMNKYLRNVVVDYIISDAGYFQVSAGWGGESIEEDVIELIEEEAGVISGGRVYGKIFDANEFISEEYFRKLYGKYNSEETVDFLVGNAQRNEDGFIADRVQLYGMEEFLIDKMRVIEGDAEKLKNSTGNYIAAVYMEDDYAKPNMESNWAKIGDKVTIRYIEEAEYYNPDTNEVYEGDIPQGVNYEKRVLNYRDVEYEVVALVTIPHTLSYRYYGADEFVLGAEAFIRDSKTNSVMYYAFDNPDEMKSKTDQLLADFTTKVQTQYDYESRESYTKEFESFRSMFAILGGVLSFIIGMVGVLNFLNAVLTSIITRRKEFAMLQSIGMTGKQLKGMLVWESLFYTVGSVLLCLLLTIITGPLVGKALENVFWFFRYQFTIVPIVLCIPLMIFIAILVPYVGYKNIVKQSIVERLRQNE